MSGALFNQEDVAVVTPELVAELRQRAESSPQKRYRFCLHRQREDPVNEMVLVLCGQSYLRPHRHPADKNESYHVLEGELTVYLFDDQGRVTRTVELAAAHTGRPFLYRLCAPIWHMPVPRTPVVVYHEVMTGPFDKDRDVEYAPWSPEESDTDAAEAFLRQCGAAVSGAVNAG